MFSKKQYKAHNSRRFKRLRADYLIKYQTAGMDGAPFLSNLKDISAGGAKFWAGHLVTEAALLKISFLIPPLAQVVETLARVVRVRPSRQGIFYVAVRFIEISGSAQRTINDFIESLSALPEAGDLVEHAPVVKRSASLLSV